MVLRAVLVFLFLMMSVGFTGAQQGERLPTKLRVSARVSGKNLSLTTEVESYLKRELRSLGDVEIVDFGIYELYVMIMESKYKSSGTKTGEISYSYVGVKRFNPFNLKAKLPREHFDTVFDATSNLYYLPDLHGMGIDANRDELKQLCQSIVAKFDTLLLEPDRSNR